ncbi:HU family DNA-binding protein [Hymenobacter jeollabukensis]|uniref:DNA-binding protein n=1 Tax=Hymenobacter jeollabukensis TaxID=2025313 RepID=A0A5R8WV85_9BACT|nr:HU family DNA-binding protein [Hymenobacter jeollabukensis]TLM95403.1 DNA-binding protein [Hymenobacter jeollabukensis]
MPIEYSLVQRGLPGTTTGPKKWYASVRSRGVTTERGMADKISRSTSLSSSDVKAALESLLQEIPRELAEGQIVQLGDLGSFRVTLQSDGTDTESAFTAAQIRKIKVNFVPSALFEQLLGQAVLRRVEAAVPAAERKAAKKG